MSLFGVGGGFATAGMEVDQAKVELAQHEVEILMGLHDTIVRSCRSKCLLPYFSETELTKGETVCVDRCVHKFFQANQIIGTLMALKAEPETMTATGAVLPTLGQNRIPTLPH